MRLAHKDRASGSFATKYIARANAVLYTLVETARANDLNVYAYLDYLLAEMPNADFYNHPEIIDDMLPWSDKLPESCRLTHKHKKNFKK